MLDVLRHQGLKSVVYGVLIVATVVVFVVQFRPGAQQGPKGSLQLECAAEVRGQCIEPKDYFAELALVAPGRMVEPAQLKAMGVRRVVLDGVIERTLLAHDAARLGVTVSEDEIDDELAAGRARVSLPADKLHALAYPLRLGLDMVRLLPVVDPKTKTFDYKNYDKVVRQFSGRSPEQFKTMQRAELLAARVRDLVRQRVRVGDAEAFAAYSREKSTTTVRFARFERKWFARNAIDLSPAAVDTWAAAHEAEVAKAFEARKSQYLPECRVLRQIAIKVAEGATDDEKAAEHKRLDDALARIARGESFADVARDVSDDEAAAEGGDLGCVGKGKLPKPLEEAAWALAPGKTSDIVASEAGLFVLRLEGIHKDADAEAFGRHDSARGLMMALVGEELAAASAKRVLEATRGGAKLDDAVAKAVADALAWRKGKKVPTIPDDSRPKVEISSAFTVSADPLRGAAPGQGVASMAFALAKEGDVPGDVVKLDVGYAVLQLKEKAIATREQFDKDREAFVAAMTTAKQADALAGYVARLREQAKSEIRINEAYANTPDAEKPGDEE